MKTNSPAAIPHDVSESLLLADLVDEIEQRLTKGQDVDIAEFARRYPGIADQLTAAHTSLVSIRQMFAAVDAQAALDVDLGETGRLGDFRLVGEIGRGGMGVVYEAEQISLGRQVAIKILPFAALLDQRQLERFKNEARAAAMLKHSNIVSVHSVGCERGIHYYAMELVRGQSLAELVAGWKLDSHDDSVRQETTTDHTTTRQTSIDTQPIAALSTRNGNNQKSFFRSVASLGIQVADALDYAHQMGVIHRDIKPSNLLLDQDGKVQITDFGLARIQAGDDLTMTGDVLGTLRYMSPEQLERGHVVDQRTDVYSLGLTLFELIAGEAAFAAVGRHELTAQILHATPRFSSEIRQRLPRDLETIIGKATDKDPNCRYATAADMSADLQRFLDQKPIAARRTGSFERARRWAGRNRALAISLATVSFLLALLAAGSSMVAWELSTEAKRNQAALYAGDMRLAQTSLRNGDRLAVEKALLKWVPEKVRDDDLRDFEWYYLWNSCHHPAIERTISHQLFAFAVEFVSDDSDQLAIGWFNDYVNVWDWRDSARSDPMQSLHANVAGVHALLRVADRNWLITGAKGQVTIWDLETGQTVGAPIKIVLPSDNGNEVLSLSLHTDGNLLAIGSGGTSEGTVRVWDIERQDWVATIDGYPGACRALFVNDTQLAVTSERINKLEVWKVGTWKQEKEYDLGADRVTAIAFSKQQHELALGTVRDSGSRQHSSVTIWNVDRWQPVAERALHAGEIESVTYSSDGQYMATSASDHAITLIDLEKGRVVVVEAAHAGTVRSVAFAPNGNHLASAGHDNQVHVWNVDKLLSRTSSSDVIPENDSIDGIPHSVFIDDGQTVATSRYDGEVSLWDAHDGRTLFDFHVDWPDWLVQLAASPKKSLIAVTCGRFLQGQCRERWNSGV